MTRTILLVVALIGMFPAVAMALVSVGIAIFSVLVRPVSFGFRLYLGPWSTNFTTMAILPASCILLGGALILFGIIRVR